MSGGATSNERRQAACQRTELYGKRGRLRSSDSGVRHVATTYGKSKIRVASSKGHNFLVESPAEIFACDLLSVDPTVIDCRPQPFKVDLVDGRICRTAEEIAEARARHKKREGWKFYTPDFSAKRWKRPEAVIEVKAAGYAGDDDYGRKLDGARDILEAHAYQFLQLTVPSDPRHPIRATLSLLKIAMLRTDLWPGAELADQIHEICGESDTTLGEICKALGLSVNLAPIWLASGVLGADLANHPICGALRVHSAHGDLGHLALLDGFCR